MVSRRRIVQGVCAGVLLVAGLLLRSDSPDPLAEARRRESRMLAPNERDEAIARAQLWRAPQTPIALASLRPEVMDEVECRYTLSDLDTTNPRFRCVLESGEEVRAKYGSGGEIPAEGAATRLLSALGFGADRVVLVKRLRCYGCPKEPGVQGEDEIDRDTFEEFEWVALEYPFWAPAIETQNWKGWAFFELRTVDSSKGGAPREHVDALRLLAVFLAHWDNKPDNQRLVCLTEPWPEKTPCSAPFLMLQDVGSTFGPRKADLAAWESRPLWEDRSTCLLSMRDMPQGGGTFQSTRVSEAGRRFLAALLGELTDAQLADLFSGAGFDRPRLPLMKTTPVSDWVRVFRQRVRAISDGPACPGG